MQQAKSSPDGKKNDKNVFAWPPRPPLNGKVAGADDFLKKFSFLKTGGKPAPFVVVSGGGLLFGKNRENFLQSGNKQRTLPF